MCMYVCERVRGAGSCTAQQYPRGRWSDRTRRRGELTFCAAQCGVRVRATSRPIAIDRMIFLFYRKCCLFAIRHAIADPVFAARSGPRHATLRGYPEYAPFSSVLWRCTTCTVHAVVQSLTPTSVVHPKPHGLRTGTRTDTKSHHSRPCSVTSAANHSPRSAESPHAMASVVCTATAGTSSPHSSLGREATPSSIALD